MSSSRRVVMSTCSRRIAVAPVTGSSVGRASIPGGPTRGRHTRPSTDRQGRNPSGSRPGRNTPWGAPGRRRSCRAPVTARGAAVSGGPPLEHAGSAAENERTATSAPAATCGRPRRERFGRCRETSPPPCARPLQNGSPCAPRARRRAFAPKTCPRRGAVCRRLAACRARLSPAFPVFPVRGLAGAPLSAHQVQWNG
jgi:hypothetical protein